MALSEDDIKDSHLEAVKQYKAGRPDEAWKTYCKTLDENFHDFRSLYGMALVEKDAGRFGLAYNLFRMAAALEDRSPDPWNGMGLCHEESFDMDDAEKCFRQALKRKPDMATAMSNLALVYLNRCQPEEALKWANRALQIDPAMVDTRHHRAYANLLKRNWKDGWEGFSEILGKVKTRTMRSYEGVPKWDGKPGTVIVYGEQGLGDEISFASCIPDLMKENQVILDCDHRLEGLFRRSFPGVTVHGTRFKTVEWIEDVQATGSCAIGDLPKYYRNADAEFPGTAYLKADPERRLQWRALFDTMRKPVIGIAWTGGVNNTGKKRRSLTLEDFLPLFRAVDATWVSLEYRNRDDEIQAFKAKTGIEIHEWKRATQAEDYDETAGMVSELDLVISVTTAVIHLSGALGVPCWCMAPSRPRWFYGLQGELPWYKSVSMFRQTDTWPIAKMADLLKLRFA